MAVVVVVVAVIGASMIIEVTAHDCGGNTDVGGLGLVLWLQLRPGICGVHELVSWCARWVGSTG